MPWIVVVGVVVGCAVDPGSEESSRVPSPAPTLERLAGEADVVPSPDELERGRVLMSYSGCFACHKESDRKRGPALSDIATRYPMNSGYIDVLAKRVILGTKGTWGNAVMLPHPKLTQSDVETMVCYILSLHGKAP